MRKIISLKKGNVIMKKIISLTMIIVLSFSLTSFAYAETINYSKDIN